MDLCDGPEPGRWDVWLRVCPDWERDHQGFCGRHDHPHHCAARRVWDPDHDSRNGVCSLRRLRLPWRCPVLLAGDWPARALGFVPLADPCSGNCPGGFHDDDHAGCRWHERRGRILCGHERGHYDCWRGRPCHDRRPSGGQLRRHDQGCHRRGRVGIWRLTRWRHCVRHHHAPGGLLNRRRHGVHFHPRTRREPRQRLLQGYEDHDHHWHWGGPGEVHYRLRGLDEGRDCERAVDRGPDVKVCNLARERERLLRRFLPQCRVRHAQPMYPHPEHGHFGRRGPQQGQCGRRCEARGCRAHHGHDDALYQRDRPRRVVCGYAVWGHLSL
mmetsp:Transcript_32310/g.75481  ORF Transcript_32310/g.75481 Transcript_32310/m.75481 type:complete len:327 (-) Transcript_32310:5402-6382(-)